ncbi:MAG: metallophosphoesterase [Labilithrix sp.]|nr:metallophosphoesterase [Labilithrix sp.]
MSRRQRLSRFRKILLSATLVVHLPFVVAAAEVLRRLGVTSLVAWLVALALGGAGVLLFNGRAHHLAEDWHRPWWQTWLVDLPYFFHWCACVFCLVPSAVYLLLEPLVSLIRGVPIGPSPSFFMWTYAIGLVVGTYGCTVRRWFFVTRRVEVGVRGLDERFDGYTIAQLSDLHIGAFHPLWWARRWSRSSNALGADLVVVTGDMVTSGVAFHEDIAELLGELRAKDGVYAIMGNHDYFGEGEPLVSLLRGRGVHVLRNDSTVLERDGAKLFLTGVDDTWTKRANLDAALEKRPNGVPTVLLAHDPDAFPSAAARKVDVVLSGHTHGGQVAVPFLSRFVNASKLAHRFHIGRYQQGDSTLYVHGGLGTTGPPVRIGVAPSIALITLRRIREV